MRKQFCDAMVARAADPNMVFLTGDLGFMALEPLQAALGERFINAGVAEQNMVTVAAAMARQGLNAWAYSIAPFCYARPFEQIRNDVTFHNLPVKLVGNGGGYGYGVMGPTHHAIEDYGILLTLPNMEAYVPVFDDDLDAVIERASASTFASYIRLGRGEPPKDYKTPAYAPWRQLTDGDELPIVAVGPLAGTYISACEALPKSRRPNLWAVAELCLQRHPPPAALVEQMQAAGRVCVAEEHVRHGGYGSDFALYLMENGLNTLTMRHFYARAHHYERYGSQGYLRRQSHLDADSMLGALLLS